MALLRALCCALHLAIVLGTGVIPRSPATKGLKVYMMILAVDGDEDQLMVRIPHLMLHQNFDFEGGRVLILDTHGKDPGPGILGAARSLIKQGHLDKWKTVNYSPNYIKGINETAAWGDWGRPRGFGDGTVLLKTVDGKTKGKGNLAYYFMFDAFKDADYIIHFDMDMVFWSKEGVSWVESAIAVMQAHAGVTLVMPPYPAMEKRVLSLEKTSKPIVKTLALGKPLPKDAPWVDLTCQKSWSLAGRNFAMDAKRYASVGPRNNYLEQRCVARNAKCDDPYPCGGHRHWELALACAMCSSPEYHQVQLTDPSKFWSQHGPSVHFRSNLTQLAGALDLADKGEWCEEGIGFGNYRCWGEKTGLFTPKKSLPKKQKPASS